MIRLFCWAQDRNLNPGFLLLFVIKCNQAIPPINQTRKLTEMIRLFCWAKERDLNPGFLFIRENYPSDTSNAKADSNDEAFLLGAGKEFEPWVPLYDELSYPSGTSNAKADRNDKAFLFLAKERDLNPRVPFTPC
jgi:hypothetical protein